MNGEEPVNMEEHDELVSDDGDAEQNSQSGSGSEETSSEGEDSELDIDAIGLELGESLWAGIAQSYSSNPNSAAVADSNAGGGSTHVSPEQKLIPTIQRILTYLSLDPEMESTFKGRTLTHPSPHSSSTEDDLGVQSSQPETTSSDPLEKDLLTSLRSLANTGVVDTETASALARTILEIAEDPIFLSELNIGGVKRKRDDGDDGEEIKEEEQ